MILTVTPNTGIDWTIILAQFGWNETLRAGQNAWGMGGKPTDASWILGELGIQNRAMGFAAGLTGVKMEQMLNAKGVETDFIPVGGETRLNVIVVNKENSSQSTLTTDTLIVTPEHVSALLEKYEATLDTADAVITGGSLPNRLEPEIFQDLIEMANRKNVPIVFDSSGNNLAPGVAKHPTVIKPNRTELATLVGRPIRDINDAYQAAKDIFEKYGCEVIVTMGGDEDALAFLKNRSYLIPNVKVSKVVSTAGAGDGVLAGIAYALAKRKPLEEGLRLGFAAAAAVITTPGTADCQKEDVEAFLTKVQLIPYQFYRKDVA